MFDAKIETLLEVISAAVTHGRHSGFRSHSPLSAIICASWSRSSAFIFYKDKKELRRRRKARFW